MAGGATDVERWDARRRSSGPNGPRLVRVGPRRPKSATPRTPQPAELVRPDPHPAAAWWRAALIGAAALALALGLLWALRLLARPLTLLFIAIVLAETLSPIVDRLERRLPRGLAVGLVYAVLVAVFAGLGWLVVPSLATQATRLVEDGPDLLERTRRIAERWAPGGSDRLLEGGQGALGRFAAPLIDLPFRILRLLTEVVVVLFLSVYWLMSRPALGRFVRSLLPAERHAAFDRVTGELGWAVGGYFRGEGLTAILMAMIVYAGLTVIGVEYALVLALLTGIGELVPVLGPVLAAIPALGIALLDSPTKAAIVLVFFLIVQQLESNVLLPQIMQRQAHVPPLLALFAIFAGGTIGGVHGAIAAVPLVAALRVLVEQLGAPAVRRWTGASDTSPES
jgi:predicted PurR-regulated permease PerM